MSETPIPHPDDPLRAYLMALVPHALLDPLPFQTGLDLLQQMTRVGSVFARARPPAAVELPPDVLQRPPDPRAAYAWARLLEWHEGAEATLAPGQRVRVRVWLTTMRRSLELLPRTRRLLVRERRRERRLRRDRESRGPARQLRRRNAAPRPPP